MNELNADFSIRLILKTLDEEDDGLIYKSLEIPAAIGQFLAVSKSDVKIRQDGINNIVDTAFGVGPSTVTTVLSPLSSVTTVYCYHRPLSPPSLRNFPLSTY